MEGIRLSAYVKRLQELKRFCANGGVDPLLVYSIDDEGNGFNSVLSLPGLANLDDDDFPKDAELDLKTAVVIVN